MICRRSVQKRLRRKIRSGKDKIVLRSLADMDIIKEKEVLFMNIETIKNAVLKLIDQYPISKVILFGSRANGTNRENSDIDLIMEFYAPVTLITLSAIKRSLEEMLHLSVDVIHGPVMEGDMIETGKEIVLYAA